MGDQISYPCKTVGKTIVLYVYSYVFDRNRESNIFCSQWKEDNDDNNGNDDDDDDDVGCTFFLRYYVCTSDYRKMTAAEELLKKTMHAVRGRLWCLPLSSLRRPLRNFPDIAELLMVVRQPPQRAVITCDVIRENPTHDSICL
jgi:hypothetical protein